MAQELKVTVDLANEKVRFTGAARSNPPVTFDDAGDEDVQKAIHLSEESVCPVWAMLKGNVEIQVDFRIVKP